MNTLSNAQNEFVKNLVSSLEKNRIPWQATWDQSILKPYNATSNNDYQGINQLNLWMSALQHGYDDPRWMTFKQANEKGYRIKKGSVGTYVFNYALRNLETKQLVAMEEYQKMSDKEREKIKPFSKTYKVFNGSQIDGMPILNVKEHQVRFENNKAVEFVNVLHKAINLKVEQIGQRAFYRPAEDKVIIPPQETFIDEQSFYATLLHETAHATSHVDRLHRNISTQFGSPEYAMEELRAELTSAFLTLDVGFHFDQFHENNHAAYIQSWIAKIKENPSVIFDSIKDAQKIRQYMLEKGEYQKIYAQESIMEENKEDVAKNIEEETVAADDEEFDKYMGIMEQNIDEDEEDVHELLEKMEQSLQEEKTNSKTSIIQEKGQTKKTVVINIFAGPGAGKTTCAWEMASKLKKLGYGAECVPEYAKELVWDENMELLDGSLEHQQIILKEQMHRIDRLIGKVDFVVTDSPILLNVSYLKEHDQNIVSKYEQEVLKSFNSKHNFSIFIQRGNSFETIGRIHNQEEAIKLDQEIKGLLDKHKIFYGNYKHDAVDKSIENCIKTYDRINKISIENMENDKLMEGIKEKNKVIDVKQIPLDDLKNSISIVDYARGVLGYSVIKEARGMFRLEDHDSCKIYPNNTFYRFSRSQGGSILDFIKHFEECDTKEAIEKMQNYYSKYHPNMKFDSTSGKTFTRDIKDMELPEKADTNKHVYAYLTKTRGINPSIVQDYIDRKILYEDTNRNCVFVGKLNGAITYATLRSSNHNSTFKQDVLGSIKETGIYIDNGSDILVVNEATIDQMSYQSLTDNPKAYNYLSTCGAANCVSAIRLHMVKRPEALNTKKIIFGLDNDEAGEVNTHKALDYVKENYPNIETFVHIPEANDFNEQLKNELNILASVGQDNVTDVTDLATA